MSEIGQTVSLPKLKQNLSQEQINHMLAIDQKQNSISNVHQLRKDQQSQSSHKKNYKDKKLGNVDGKYNLDSNVQSRQLSRKATESEKAKKNRQRSISLRQKQDSEKRDSLQHQSNLQIKQQNIRGYSPSKDKETQRSELQNLQGQQISRNIQQNVQSSGNNQQRVERSGKSNNRNKDGREFRKAASLNQFKLISSIGDGAYSKVFKVKRIVDNQLYALKMVALKNLSDKEKDNAINEVRILASIQHPNIISYKEAFIDKQSESLCIVMELVDMGDLYGQIVKNLKRQGSSIPQAEMEYEGLSEDFIWKVFIQVVKGLKSMHDLNIMHRDLKSANVFLNSDDTVKLGDMNVSKVATKEGLNFTQTGTPYYASPEVWKDEPYDIKSDIWSLGCVLYEMITLKPPFQASSMKGLFKRVCAGKISRIPKHYSPELWTIVKQMLNVNPKARPDCTKILESQIVQQREQVYASQQKHQQNVIMYQNSSQTHSELLKTIIFPKNLTNMHQKLPAPRYNDTKSEQGPTTQADVIQIGDQSSIGQQIPKNLNDYSSQYTKETSNNGGIQNSITNHSQAPQKQPKTLTESIKHKNQQIQQSNIKNQKLNIITNNGQQISSTQLEAFNNHQELKKVIQMAEISANDAAAAVARRQNINNSQSMNNYQVAALINQQNIIHDSPSQTKKILQKGNQVLAVSNNKSQPSQKALNDEIEYGYKIQMGEENILQQNEKQLSLPKILNQNKNGQQIELKQNALGIQVSQKSLLNHNQKYSQMHAAKNRQNKQLQYVLNQNRSQIMNDEIESIRKNLGKQLSYSIVDQQFEGEDHPNILNDLNRKGILINKNKESSYKQSLKQQNIRQYQAAQKYISNSKNQSLSPKSRQLALVNSEEQLPVTRNQSPYMKYKQQNQHQRKQTHIDDWDHNIQREVTLISDKNSKQPSLHESQPPNHSKLKQQLRQQQKIVNVRNRNSKQGTVSQQDRIDNDLDNQEYINQEDLVQNGNQINGLVAELNKFHQIQHHHQQIQNSSSKKNKGKPYKLVEKSGRHGNGESRSLELLKNQHINQSILSQNQQYQSIQHSLLQQYQREPSHKKFQVYLSNNKIYQNNNLSKKGEFQSNSQNIIKNGMIQQDIYNPTPQGNQKLINGINNGIYLPNQNEIINSINESYQVMPQYQKLNNLHRKQIANLQSQLGISSPYLKQQNALQLQPISNSGQKENQIQEKGNSVSQSQDQMIMKNKKSAQIQFIQRQYGYKRSVPQIESQIYTSKNGAELQSYDNLTLKNKKHFENQLNQQHLQINKSVNYKLESKQLNLDDSQNNLKKKQDPSQQNYALPSLIINGGSSNQKDLKQKNSVPLNDINQSYGKIQANISGNQNNQSRLIKSKLRGSIANSQLQIQFDK